MSVLTRRELLPALAVSLYLPSTRISLQTLRPTAYLAPDGRIMLVPYTASGDAFQAEKPRVWSETPVQRRRPVDEAGTFDLHPDGARVAMAPGVEATAGPTHVTPLFNFFDELRRMAPVTKR